jgi:peptidoglycan hydrolase-like protein with peptidoglycan-binding domain
VENGQISEKSAVQFVRQTLGLQVWVVATLADLLQYLQAGTQLQAEAAQVAAYRQQYGVTSC